MRRTIEDIRSNLDHVGCDNETAEAIANDAANFGTGFAMITAEGIQRIAPEDVFIRKPKDEPDHG